MIPVPRLSLVWNLAMGGFGLVFWAYAVLTIVLPGVFAPHGYILAILGALLAIFFFVTQAVAGRESAERAWDESVVHDSNRAYRFGFTVACSVYFLFWLLVARGWTPVEAAFPAMGALTGGSYCLFMGITGLRGWFETRNTPD